MTFFAQGARHSHADLLQEREARQEAQARALLRFPEHSLLTFHLNLPGPIKQSPGLHAFYDASVQRIEAALPGLERLETRGGPTGDWMLWKSAARANRLKRACLSFEQAWPVSSLWDLDVCDQEGRCSRESLGLPPRPCWLCEAPAKSCARAQVHPLAALQAKALALILAFDKDRGRR